MKENSKRASDESTATPGLGGSYQQLAIRGSCHEAVYLMTVLVSRWFICNIRPTVCADVQALGWCLFDPKDLALCL